MHQVGVSFDQEEVLDCTGTADAGSNELSVTVCQLTQRQIPQHLHLCRQRTRFNIRTLIGRTTTVNTRWPATTLTCRCALDETCCNTFNGILHLLVGLNTCVLHTRWLDTTTVKGRYRTPSLPKCSERYKSTDYFFIVSNDFRYNQEVLMV